MNKKDKNKVFYGELPLENITFVSNGEKPYAVFKLDENGNTIALSKKCIFKGDKTFKFLIVPTWDYELRLGDFKRTMNGTQIFETYIQDKIEVKKLKPYEKL